MDVGTAIASAFSAGISMYGVIAALGIAGRLDIIDAPAALEQPWVIGLALAAFAVEFVVDKIPLIDSVWDTAHLALRPLAGSVIMGITPDQPLPMPVAIALGGALALTSHSAKSATRVLVNASPEPVSNVVVSSVEDGIVAVLMALAFANPAVALAITAALVVIALGIIVLAWRAVRRFRRKQSARVGSPTPPGDPPPGGG